MSLHQRLGGFEHSSGVCMDIQDGSESCPACTSLVWFKQIQADDFGDSLFDALQ